MLASGGVGPPSPVQAASGVMELSLLTVWYNGEAAGVCPDSHHVLLQDNSSQCTDAVENTQLPLWESGANPGLQTGG